jgi:hypothetical protein
MQLQALNNTGSAFCVQARRHYRVNFSCTLIAHMRSLEMAPDKFCQPHHSQHDDGLVPQHAVFQHDGHNFRQFVTKVNVS